VSHGDIDNRVKTVIDCLRQPRNQLEVPNDPRDGEDPFFCLLEDDKQVHRLMVETDTLLDPQTEDSADQRKVKLVVTVELRPYYVTMFDLSFA
jgi:hypothetical protein